MGSASADGLEGRNRSLGAMLLGVIVLLIVLAIIRVLTHS
jgi:hypothetical protein